MSEELDIYAAAELKKKMLEESPVVTVTGIVAPYGAGGGKTPDQEFWTLSFNLDGWRMGGDALQTGSLLVTRPVTDEELKKYQALITSYKIIEMRARVAVYEAPEKSRALLEEITNYDAADPELIARAAELQKPVYYKDPKFGTFTFDRGLEWYGGQASWNGAPVELTLSAADETIAAEALKTAAALWADEAGWGRRVGDYAVEELLPLKNDNWLDDNEEELTAGQFLARMKLESITVYPGGEFDFWHDDGDLFFGHSIQISGSLTAGLTVADIPG